MTITPSERHSGLLIRLSRYRRSDPAINYVRPEFLPFAGHDMPSVYLPEDVQHAEIDLPDYDLRRIMGSQDPLSCLYSFFVHTTVMLPNLYGFRMCPACPHCCESEKPCMDIYGSNATPLGGSAGRADQMVGAVEAQKAEGVLHLHLFLFLQMAMQFKTLKEIAEMFRQGFLHVSQWKTYMDNTRIASYPSQEELNRNGLRLSVRGLPSPLT